MIPRYISLGWQGLAPALKNHLWQSTLFLIIAALLTLVLRKNQARTRYWLWLAASLKFLVPLSLLIALGSHLAVPHRTLATPSNAYVAMDEFSQPFTTEVAPQTVPAAITRAPSPDLSRRLPRLLAAVWFTGFATVLCVWSVYWRRISAVMQDAVPIGEGRELEALHRLVGLGEVRGQIRMLSSASSMEPGIFGIFRPVLIWPTGISYKLNKGQLEAILAHEVCHVRRRDNLTAAIHMVVEAVFWFHPLVWWLGARLLEERERACDEEVLRLCKQPEVYAEGILKVCEFCLESPLPCVSGVTGSDLKKRIVNVLSDHMTLRLDLWKKLLLIVAGLAVVAVPIVLGQVKAARRMMLAAVNSAPAPSREAHERIPEEETGEFAEAQAGGPTLMNHGNATQPPAKHKQVEEFYAVRVGDGQAQATSSQDTQVAVPTVPQIKFDVVTFKPCAQIALTMKITIIPQDGDFIAKHCQTVASLILVGYLGRGPLHLSGQPAWVDTDPYEFEAKVAPEDVATWQKMTLNEKRAMVWAALVDILHIKTHVATETHPIYALIVAKSGPKLTEYKEGEETKLAGDRLFKGRDVVWVGSDRAYYQGTSMGGLAEALSARLDRPVVDKTMLKGLYDVTLTMPFLHYDPKTASVEDDKFAEIFDGVKTLGLRLEPDKGELIVTVVDHIDRPPEN